VLQPASSVEVAVFNFLIRGGNAVGRDIAEIRALFDIVHAPVADVAGIIVQAAVGGVPFVDLAWGELAPRGYASCVRRDSSQ
jgi:hypothetical protein